MLASEADKQAYAAGVSLGRDIVHLQQENRHAGLEADSRLLLAGIADTAGRLRLDEAAIDSALRTAQQRLLQTRAPPPPLDDKAYLADFARREGVKQDALGFYYRVDYAGNGAIGADDRVDIVVRERHGRRPGGQRYGVGRDGDLAAVDALSAAVSRRYREAAAPRLDHAGGAAGAGVTASRAATGNPPDATMIYTLRIADVQP